MRREHRWTRIQWPAFVAAGGVTKMASCRPEFGWQRSLAFCFWQVVTETTHAVRRNIDAVKVKETATAIQTAVVPSHVARIIVPGEAATIVARQIPALHVTMGKMMAFALPIQLLTEVV